MENNDEYYLEENNKYCDLTSLQQVDYMNSQSKTLKNGYSK